MTISEMCKQYIETVCQLDMRRKLLKEQLKRSNNAKKSKELEIRIGILSEEIYETKEIAKFLSQRYGGDRISDKNI